MTLLPPFDLHVLGTPPAFILSQDQTLRILCPVSQGQQSHTPVRLPGSFLTRAPSSTRLLPLLAVLSYHDSVVKVPQSAPEKQKTGLTYRLQTYPFSRMYPFVCLSSVCCLPRMYQSSRPFEHRLTLECRGVYQSL